MRRWWRWIRWLGWLLLGVAAVAVSVLVVVRAWIADVTVADLTAAHANPDAIEAAKDAFDRWTGWANIIALPAGAAGLIILAVEKLIRSFGTFGDGDRLAAELAASVLNTTSAELVYRQARNPAPIVVRWSASGRPAAGHDAVLGDGTRGGGSPLILDGDALEVVDHFRALPHRQLAVLGGPGAGKSVLTLLLTQGLLQKPEDGGRVPVVMALSGWRPGESLTSFLERELVELYPKVLDNSRRTARWLIEHRRIMPVLDGLDELPPGSRAEAVRQIDEYGLLGNHLVVTSRGLEYEEAVNAGGVLLTTAAVVEIGPVAPDVAISYLSYPELRRPLWEPVFDRLRTDPDAPIAQVLSSPLMIALARSAYRRDPHRPAELLTFDRRQPLARRLFDVFVSAAYDERKSARARRHLSTLAYHLYETGTRDWHWWQVKVDLLARHPRTTRVATIATGLLLLTAGAALAGQLANGVGCAIEAGLVGLVLPAFVLATPWRFARIGLGQSAVSAASGLAAGFLLHDWRVALIGAAISGGATFAVHRTVNRVGPDRARSFRPATDMSDPAIGWAYSLTGALSQVGVGLVALLLQTSVAVSPAAFVMVAVYGGAGVLANGGWQRLLFRLTHLRLAATGRLPLRLSGFLDDAYRRRAVLRRAGPVYQFRHALLQDHLALVEAAEHTRAVMKAGDKEATKRLTSLLTRLERTDDVIALLRQRFSGGDRYVAWQLADLLIQRGDVEQGLDVLREVAADRRKSARHDRRRLARLLVEHGRIDELRRRSDKESAEALLRHLVDVDDLDGAIKLVRASGRSDSGLVDRLVEAGRFEDVRALAERGDLHGVTAYLDHLVRRRRFAAAEALIAALPLGQDRAARQFDELLLEHQHFARALRRARAAYREDEAHAATWLARVLAAQGRVEAAITVLRKAPGDQAANELIFLLLDAGRAGEALALAIERPGMPSGPIVERLVEQLHPDDAEAFLRARAATGRRHGIGQLVTFLLARGRLDAAAEAVGDEDPFAREAVANKLAENGRVDEAIALMRQAKGEGAERDLIATLARAGREDELNSRADAGEPAAVAWRVDRLAGNGQLDRAVELLRAGAAKGDLGADWAIASLLARHGRLDEATALIRRRADAGDSDAQGWLDAAERGDLFP
ncbi:hypothetical protein GCM10010172_87390 [Paractinoplanes ferrugineus]|uniref:NACHT domain-containing protein n=1 Tax=Paractinoplanes ferrugineus TaxID=113564 RepID=A0A919JAH9_9ACTN|nr:hypothetical protein [Actinoplanes ferrugineus]GIE16514.1 hypothetical protein Afe05nite_83540 [Actinoplanes ferrugineus]